MKKSQKETALDFSGKKVLIVVCLFFLAVGSAAYGYGGDEHADITPKAINNYYNWVFEDPDNRVGAAAVAEYQDNVAIGSVDEDKNYSGNDSRTNTVKADIEVWSRTIRIRLLKLSKHLPFKGIIK